MKLLTDQTVKPVVGAVPEPEESQPWEEPIAEAIEAECIEEVEDPPKETTPECVQMFVRLEGTSCIRLDSLGGGKIQLAFSDAQSQEAFELGKYRGLNLLATFMICRDQMAKKTRRKS